ncbi:hypothetical protein [Virgibacillus sp. YIM 98842]|jgi:hypothetical protein|uniref:hypothetical protein n=1 Tax=Virgibacillus sp. YIM 98842 TaxID=2663533 RepID=UPI0013D97EE1|nr:hypothetical protein [Virgibacillus sp. YIM 98842]
MGRRWTDYLLVFCTVSFFLVLLYPQSASAHRMLVEHEEEGIIHVRYDDGTAAGAALVTAYDAKGDILFESEADEDGILNYERELEVHRLTADDGMGHRATWTDEEETSILDDIPLFVRAIFGISILLFLAAIFFSRTNRKPGEGEEK